MSVSDHRYLIIGGAPKSGTTSLYKWLSEHPEVCPSSLKETRFFLDVNYPLISPKIFNGANIEEYDGYFKRGRETGNQLRVDASPDYLYSNIALNIAELLPQSKIVFILRDPVERMVSWYKWARQLKLLDEGTDFDDYVMMQVNQSSTQDTPIHLRALDQCRYDKYLPSFQKAFGERCMVIDFEDLKNTPREVMKRISTFAEIADSYFDQYQFRAENVSQAVRNQWVMQKYYWLLRRLSAFASDKPAIKALLKFPNRIIKKCLSINHTKADEVQVSEELSEIIRKYCQPNF